MRASRWLVVVLLLAGCAAPAGEPPPVGFTRVDVPGAPVRLAAGPDGDLLVAVRRDGRPGLVRHAADGTNIDIPLTPATEYGAEALWYSAAIPKRPFKLSALSSATRALNGSLKLS